MQNKDTAPTFTSFDSFGTMKSKMYLSLYCSKSHKCKTDYQRKMCVVKSSLELYLVRSVEEREKKQKQIKEKEENRRKIRFYFDRRQSFSWLLHCEQKLWIYTRGK